MNSFVLLTGGAGFIGTRLAGRLLREGHEVALLDVLHPQVHPARTCPADVPPGARLFPCDATSPADWDAVLRLVRPTAIVHLAAETGTGQSLLEASRHARVNVEGTTQMLDALARNDVLPSQIVLTSSRAVYGEGRWRRSDGTSVYPGVRRREELGRGLWDPVDDDGRPLAPEQSRAGYTEPRPSNIYAATKLAQEHVLGAWTAAMGVALSVLRLQNVVGPGQAVGNAYTGVLTLFARVALEGGVIDVYEDGRIVRDFVYVDDVVSAIVAAIARPVDHRLCDVGSGRPTTILEAATSIASIAGAPPPAISGRFRHGDVRAAWCDIGPTEVELGWSPRWDLDAGLHELVEFVRERAIAGAVP